jgi:hypothetical protein
MKMALCLHPATMTTFQYNNRLNLSFKLPRVYTILIQIQNDAFVCQFIMNSNPAALHTYFFIPRKITFPYSLCNSCGKCIVSL